MGFAKRIRRAADRSYRRIGHRFASALEQGLERLSGGPILGDRSQIHFDGPEGGSPGVLSGYSPDDPLMQMLGRPELNNLIDRATMEKAVGLARNVAHENAERVANQEYLPTSDPRALYIDPYAIVQQLGFRERPSALTYQLQELMVWRTEVVHAIVQVRTHQMARFASPSREPHEWGYRIKMRNPDDHPTAADKKQIRKFTDAIFQCGFEKKGDSNFEGYIKKRTRNSLIHDQANTELLRDFHDRPAVWNAVDCKTIRLADSRTLYPDDDPERVHTVQVFDNVVIAEFRKRDMMFSVRNPRSDIQAYGYGCAEIDMMTTVITSLINAFQYNSAFFQQGTVAKGLLNIVGNVPDRQMKFFKKLWFEMVSGVRNAWKSVVLNAEKVEWIPLHPNNRDMEFASFFDFCIKLAAGLFLTDPIEIGFKFGNQNQRGGGMFEGANKAKAQESRERGLRPLVASLERDMNEHIIWPHSDNFRFECTGLESMTAKELADLRTQGVRSYMTVNQARAREDMEPLEDGDTILDPTFANLRNQRIQQEQQKELQAQAQAQQAALGAGAPGGTGGPGPNGPNGPTGGGKGAGNDLESALASLSTFKEKGKGDGPTEGEIKNELEAEESAKSMTSAYVPPRMTAGFIEIRV